MIAYLTPLTQRLYMPSLPTSSSVIVSYIKKQTEETHHFGSLRYRYTTVMWQQHTVLDNL